MESVLLLVGAEFGCSRQRRDVPISAPLLTKGGLVYAQFGSAQCGFNTLSLARSGAAAYDFSLRLMRRNVANLGPPEGVNARLNVSSSN